MPNPRKPLALKLLQGTTRPDRPTPPHVEYPLVTAAPEPPEWLQDPRAVAEWTRLVPILMGVGLLSEASIGSLAILCATFGAIAGLVSQGQPPPASLLSVYRALAGDFGLSAVAQQKLHPAPTPEPSNRFANLARRPGPA